MKHIKLFDNSEQYSAFKDSASFVTPNVSYIVQSGEVGYEPYTGPLLITFTLDSVTYYAEGGMTWSEWIGSKYNTSTDYSIAEGKYLVWKNGSRVILSDGPMYDNTIYGTDKIQANKVYEHTMAEPV